MSEMGNEYILRKYGRRPPQQQQGEQGAQGGDGAGADDQHDPARQSGEQPPASAQEIADYLARKYSGPASGR